MNTSLQESILSTLTYFDLFNHPLDSDEIHEYLHGQGNKEQIKVHLEQLIQMGVIFKINGYYSLQNESKWTSRRIQANALAKKKLRTARKMSRVIASMPYVKSVLLSGTMAKGVMYEDSDIDYFIITRANRLWAAKLFVVLFKKIFLLNSKKNFCVNYFLSEERLTIEDNNLFTATELATLIPTYNLEVARHFRENNEWINTFLPNHQFLPDDRILVKPLTGLPKRWLERILQGKLGNWLENYILNSVKNKYRKQYQHLYSPEDFENNFLSTRYASKVHNSNHRSVALRLFEKRMNRILNFATNHNETE